MAKTIVKDKAIMMEEIRALVSEGKTVSLTVKGNSMNPFMVHLRDQITLGPWKDEDLRKGTVALVKDIRGNYLIHRIIRRDAGTVTLLGDGNIGMTETATLDNVIAIMHSITRKGKIWTSQGIGWKAYSWLWSVLTPLRRWPLGLWRKLNRDKVFNFSHMKNILIFLTMTASLLSCTGGKDLSDNPLDVKLGDPYVLLASDGCYYMYGTGGVENGFGCYRSENLKDWEYQGAVYQGNTPDSWAESCFWAPEVYERNGKFYMFFSANWKVNPNAELENFLIGVAVSDSPTGPFKEMSDAPLFNPGYPIIDANVFFDEDGKCYLYYSRCCYKHPVESEVADWARQKGLYDEIEESWIYGIELAPDFTHVIGEPVLLLSPPEKMDDVQAEWESRSVTAGEANRRWTEGSFLIKRDGTYYMMYSANFFGGENYAVGYATSNSPLGPYTKSSDNPVLEKNTPKGGKVTGVGHNSITWSRDGKQLYCVYHGRTAETGDERVVFIDKMSIENGRLEVEGPTTKE